jgi:hypothetical protein
VYTEFVYTCQLLWSKFCLHWSEIVVKILSRLVSYCGQNSVYTGKLLWSKFCLHWSAIVVKILSTLFSYQYLSSVDRILTTITDQCRQNFDHNNRIFTTITEQCRQNFHVSYCGPNILSTLVSYSGHNSVYTGQLLWSKCCLHWSVIVVIIHSTVVSYCCQNSLLTSVDRLLTTITDQCRENFHNNI